MNEASCHTPGCREPAAWSESQQKLTKLCIHHLTLHRNRCKLTNMKKRKLQQDQAHKLQMYDKLLSAYKVLSQKYDALRRTTK